MAVKKGKYTAVLVRLPNDVVALLRARCYGEGSLYTVARNILDRVAVGTMIDCGYSSEQYVALDLLARRIGFKDIAELLHHLGLAYLRLYQRSLSSRTNNVTDEIEAMFRELSTDIQGYEEGLSITTQPRKIRDI